MKHDFFLALLLSGGSRNRTELEAETLPYTFYTPPRSLRNYRIYGNTVVDKFLDVQEQKRKCSSKKYKYN